MRSDRRTKFTQLLPLVQQRLTLLKRKEELDSFESDERLTLAIIDKMQNSPVLCVSDFRHSIQAIKTTRNAIEHVHPSSTASTYFYCIIDNSWISLNAKNQDLAEPSQYPHPYEPYFHFRDNYDEYLKEKVNMKYELKCQVIDVRRWSLKIVNISRTGYYGVVFELKDYRLTGEKFKENAADIYATIYEYSIKEKLEILRLNDMRAENVGQKDKKAPHSLFYYCRDVNMDYSPQEKVINIVQTDLEKQLLEFNNRKEYHLISFGQIKGLNCLQYPLNSEEIDKQKVNQMRLEEFKIFYNNAQSQKQVKKQKIVPQGDLWESDYQQSQENSQNQEEVSKEGALTPMIEENVDSEEDSEDDPLRKLYMKQFEDMKIV